MNIEIANRLYQYRKKTGYSQEELAEKIGVSRQAVSKWERAEASPDTDNLLLLADIYSVTLDELLKGSESALENAVVNDSPQTVKAYEEDNKKGVHPALVVSFPVIIAVIYLILGFCYGCWHPAWLLFMLVPLFFSLCDAVSKRDAKAFAYPVLAATVYMAIGFYYHIWHPSWIVFLTIPVYYFLVELFSKLKDNK